MYCSKCGKEIADGSVYCNHCAAKIIRAGSLNKRLVAIGAVIALLAAGTFGIVKWYENYREMNPVLNSSADITDELINKIITNSIDSITFNYEFTKCKRERDSDIWENEQARINPFWRANSIQPIKRIEFEVILTEKSNSLACAFYDFEKLEFVNLKDTSNVTDMSSMFAYTKAFNQPIGNWDTSHVTDMSWTFAHTRAFNQPIGNWDTSKVINMRGMFLDATYFNQSINNWNTLNVTDMSWMFAYTRSFNQTIGNWNTSNVTNMGRMFEGATVFNQPIGNWDTSKVTNMSSMFAYTRSFNQPIGNWNTSNVIDMRQIFAYTKVFNQPIDNWDTSKVTDNREMFLGTEQYKALNPVLKSSRDITPELIQKISDNSIDSLTIDYEFTRCSEECVTHALVYFSTRPELEERNSKCNPDETEKNYIRYMNKNNPFLESK